MKKSNLTQVPLWWLCFGLYVLTLLFRIYFYHNHVNFAQDQARDILAVKALYDQGHYVLGYGSKASVANFNWPPLYYQILLVVGRLTNFYPLASHWIFIVAESMTPVWLFLALKFFARTKTAIITAIIYAVAPAPTMYGTFSWNPNLIPLFTMISIYCWLGFYYLRKNTYLIWGTFLPLWAFQLHFQAGLSMLFYIGFLVWVFFKERQRFGYVFIGWLLALLVYLPYFIVEYQNHWNNSRKIIEFFTVEHNKIYDRVSKPDFIFKYIPGFFERVMLKNNFPYYLFGLSLFLFGILELAYLSYRFKKKYLILFLLILSLLIMVRVYKGDKLDYYLSAIFVVPFLLLSLILNRFKNFGLILGVIVLTVSAQATLRIPSENGFKSMLSAIDFIKPYADNGVTLHFVEPDYTYPILYGLKQANISIDPNAKTGIFICRLESSCDDFDKRKLDENVVGPYKIVITN